MILLIFAQNIWQHKFVFNIRKLKKSATLNTFYPCTKRKCKPFSCGHNPKNSIKYSKVIEFYEKAIEKVKSMTSKQLNKKDAFKFLIEIDNEVADKYSKKRQPILTILTTQISIPIFSPSSQVIN